MTRINLIDPHELTDQHLIAEYREITMVAAALKRTLNSKTGLDKNKIPKKFCLNAGHVYFFYDKGKYLHLRYQNLAREMKRRGFQPDAKRIFPTAIFVRNGLYRDWTPKRRDYEIIRRRLREKIALKPKWYRRTKKRK